MSIHSGLSTSNLYLYNAVSSSHQLKYLGKNMFSGFSGTVSGNQYGVNSSNALTQSAQDFLSDAKTKATDLLESINALIDQGSSSVFNKKAGQSSDKDVLTVKSTDNDSSGESVKVTVQQLAKQQKNEGTSMSSKGKALNSGRYTFEVEVDGKAHQFSINVGVTDDNQSIQQKMADAINEKNIGVSATVSSGSSKSALTLSSTETGTTDNGQQRFSVRDVYGDAVSKMGIGTITQEAQDAIYTENGVTQTSKSNDVELSNGVTVTLKSLSSEEVTVSVGDDTTGQVNKVRDLVNKFNALLETVNGNSGDSKSKALLERLVGTAVAYGETLKRVGININGKGYLSIDEDTMKDAAESGELKKFFESESKNINYGFTARVKKMAGDIEKDPSRFVGKDSYESVGSSNYLDTSSFILSPKYQQLSNTGLLFDMMF